jgi:L-ascorbate metabolism protein UlaG (beta-lactamase superfamily)
MHDHRPGSGHTSDHFSGRTFFNPTGANGQPLYKVVQMMRERGRSWPASVPIAPRPPPPLDGAAAVVTFIGHSSVLIQTPLGNILTDPVYAERASPVPFAGPRRARQPAVPFEALPDVAVVLLSHNHYDHCDLAALARLDTRSRPLVITPLGNRKLLESAGLRRIEEIDWWEDAAASPLPVTLTPAQHFSARGPFDRNRALWGGFVISAGPRRIYFAGDTGYAPHFLQLRERLGVVDLALLPIGAYEPRWFMKDVHMNPAEAVQAHLDLGAPPSIGMHFGTFQLTLEGIDAPLHDLAAALRARGVPERRFRTLEFGGSMRLEDPSA